jgi:hypothetical protein
MSQVRVVALENRLVLPIPRTFLVLLGNRPRRFRDGLQCLFPPPVHQRLLAYGPATGHEPRFLLDFDEQVAQVEHTEKGGPSTGLL